jgi:hypothetical protein
MAITDNWYEAFWEEGCDQKTREKGFRRDLDLSRRRFERSPHNLEHIMYRSILLHIHDM